MWLLTVVPNQSLNISIINVWSKNLAPLANSFILLFTSRRLYECGDFWHLSFGNVNSLGQWKSLIFVTITIMATICGVYHLCLVNFFQQWKAKMELIVVYTIIFIDKTHQIKMLLSSGIHLCWKWPEFLSKYLNILFKFLLHNIHYTKFYNRHPFCTL